jgi:hypothetical protein
MDPSPLFELAHGGHSGHGPPWALASIAIAAMVIPMLALAFVGRHFIRAAKRDEEARPNE